jgi:nucleotide-binding universal stress UspA family protein
MRLSQGRPRNHRWGGLGNGSKTMSWTRILAPLTGAPADAEALEAAAAFAAPFGAELLAVFAPADAADLMPWMGEGLMGGVQMAALDSMKEAAVEGERISRARFEALAYPKKAFSVLASPVWACLCMEARLCDAVVFAADPARGKGPLVEVFQQVLMEERRPVLVTRGRPDPTRPVALAWDGGKEASRAARASVPWLQKAADVVILSAPSATPRSFDPRRLADYLAGRGVKARVEQLAGSGDAGPMLLEGAKALGAGMLVAGAFGHPRFQQFIFGGATRTLMQADPGPSLFLSH